mgnify:CR=1 FL=1
MTGVQTCALPILAPIPAPRLSGAVIAFIVLAFASFATLYRGGYSLPLYSPQGSNSEPGDFRAGLGVRPFFLSHVEFLGLEAAVEIGDERAIAVEKLRRHHFTRAQHLFIRLAPARMGDLGIDVGPEPILRWTELDRKSTRLNSSHIPLSRMPSSA